MALANVARVDPPQRLLLDGQELEWRIVRSPSAKKLRIKVGPNGIQVVLPEGRDSREAAAFITDNQAWVAEQVERTRKLLAARRPVKRANGHISFRGKDVAVRVIRSDGWRASNKAALDNGAITITCAPDNKTPVSRSLENWLRKQAREQIEQHVAETAKRLKRTPERIYVMGQRTKWGNCSALGNLSFNWRLIMAPDAVLHYIVTHEMVHLAVPDHSRKFWLTVQSLCPDAERARQWLVANGQRLQSTELACLDD
ncbi:M48 family metallopeptidase [Pseudomonas taiwanensis]|uniref:M48 family metallopeptidase n=1 Tax=Pseudomonas taiwanensis TaxID=470150 RepID=UPI001647F59D|nr:SprT family zinc-dependent metalloprotease [Pseudomonas taiwanensis]MBC3493632.1 M48 family metallopeptidase [Pseudomonas taiwanensis]